jgi:hypothetical protein
MSVENSPSSSSPAGENCLRNWLLFSTITDFTPKIGEPYKCAFANFEGECEQVRTATEQRENGFGYDATGGCLNDVLTPDQKRMMLEREQALLNAIFAEPDVPTDFTDLLPDFPQPPHGEA